MKPMSREELEELRRQIGTPGPIVWPPQVRAEDMPTLQEMVRDLDIEEEDEDEGDSEDLA